MGQIGEPGQKDKLSFVSLVRQIEGTLQKGCKPLDAVVRAINPGMRLRSYLESMNDLTLPWLRSILRSHYEVWQPPLLCCGLSLAVVSALYFLEVQHYHGSSLMTTRQSLP